MATTLPDSTDPTAAEILAEIAKGRENLATNQANLQKSQAAIPGYLKSNEENELTIAGSQSNIAENNALIAKNNAEMADDTLSDDRRLELEANNAEALANNAEQLAIINKATANIETNKKAIIQVQNDIEQIQTNSYENQSVIDENIAIYKKYTGVDPVLPDLDSKQAPELTPTGIAYDDDGNLLPGWELDENNNPVEVGLITPLREPPVTEVDEFSGIDEQVQRQKDIEDGTSEFAGIDEQIAMNENTLQEPPLLSDEEVDAELARAAAEGAQDYVSEENTEQDIAATNTNVAGLTSRAASSGASAKTSPYSQDDWRVRLSLAGSANYLYKIAGKTDILYPLIATDGVVFPYTPQINSSYRANYDPSELTHSNYKMFFYKNSSVDDISITADFTAQDTAEANYMLAVIHFFKSATKMFYGQDTSPRAGTPPPLLYLTGYGQHQYQNHPLLLTNFSYNLPNDVDYIRAGSNAQWGGVSIAQVTSGSSTRLASSGLTAGGVAKPASFSGLASNDKVTYVPTKISLSLTLVPVVTRNDISKNFSLKDYAAGKFSGRAGGGIW